MTGAETAALPVPGRQLCGLAWLDGLLWFSDAVLDEIMAVDPDTGAVEHRVPCPDVRTGLTAAAGGRSLIQVVGPDKRLRTLDPRTGAVLAEHPNPRSGGELCGLHETPAGLWTGYKDPPVVELRRPPEPEPVASFPVDTDVADLTVARELVVFADHPGMRLHVLDPRAGRIVETIPVAGAPTGLTWDGHRLWYCDYDSRQLRAVEPGLAGAGVAA